LEQCVTMPSALMAAFHYTQDTKVSGFVAAVAAVL
jgi:uncharacterized membrane protein